MKRTFYRVSGVNHNDQHGCDFVTLEDSSGKRYATGEFAFATKPAVGDELVKLTKRNGAFRGYRKATFTDRVLAVFGL